MDERDRAAERWFNQMNPKDKVELIRRVCPFDVYSIGMMLNLLNASVCMDIVMTCEMGRPGTFDSRKETVTLTLKHEHGYFKLSIPFGPNEKNPRSVEVEFSPHG